MPHLDALDDKIGFACGFTGGGIHLALLTNVNFIGLASAIVTAFLCGFAGIAGKHAFTAVQKRWARGKKKKSSV